MDTIDLPVLMTGSEPSEEMTNMELKFLSKEFTFLLTHICGHFLLILPGLFKFYSLSNSNFSNVKNITQL